MSTELLSILEKILNDVNSDYVLKKGLPSEHIIVELRAIDSGSIFVEIGEKGLKILKGFCGQPNSIIISSNENLIRLLKGELDPIKAFFFGKVKVEGSLDIAYILYERLKHYQKMKSSINVKHLEDYFYPS